MWSVKRKDKSYFDITSIKNSKKNHQIVWTVFIILALKLIRSQNQFHLNLLKILKKKDLKNRFLKIKFKKFKILKSKNIKNWKIKNQNLNLKIKMSL